MLHLRLAALWLAYSIALEESLLFLMLDCFLNFMIFYSPVPYFIDHILIASYIRVPEKYVFENLTNFFLICHCLAVFLF